MNTVHVTLGRRLDQSLAALGRALGLPQHFGQNLDALADCLTELTQPTTVVLDGWSELAWSDPEGWVGLRAVLDGRAAGVAGREGLLRLPSFRVEAGTIQA